MHIVRNFLKSMLKIDDSVKYLTNINIFLKVYFMDVEICPTKRG